MPVRNSEVSLRVQASWASVILGGLVLACSSVQPPTRETSTPSVDSAASGGAAAGGSSGILGPNLDVPEPAGGDKESVTNEDSCGASQGSTGCDFYSARPPRFISSDSSGTIAVDGACFAAYVVNVSGKPISINVDFAGTQLDVQKMARIPHGTGKLITYGPLPNGMLPPKEVAILFLTHTQGTPTQCPSDVGYNRTFAPRTSDAGGSELGTLRDNAFHISTSGPVAAYDIFPYGGGAAAVTSATLLLPTTTWDAGYLAFSVNPGRSNIASTVQLVAAQDGTEVTVVPKVDIQPGAALAPGSSAAPVAGAKAGVSQTYHLNRGELLQLGSSQSELSGSPIVANKPIGVWGAMGCFVFDTRPACDSMHQQIPPVKNLGHEYVGVRHRNRFPGIEEHPPWRVMGTVDGTTLSYDPAPPVGAPTSLSGGQLVEFRAAGPFTIRSQDDAHPLYLAATMTGGRSAENDLKNSDDGRGDPEVVNVIPPQQFRTSYVFFTDPTYPETNLVVVRQKGSQAFADVKLDCMGVIGGWLPVGVEGKYEYAYVNLVSGNFEPQHGCDSGRHEMQSDGKFGVTIWGWGSAATGDRNSPTYSQFVSYAYPAGASLDTLNTVQPVVK